MPAAERVTAGQRIKNRRKAFGLTMQEVADYVGVRQPTISQWESELTLPKGHSMKRLEEVLRTNSDWILLGEGDPDARYVLVQPGSSEFKAMDSTGRRLPVISMAQALTWCTLPLEVRREAATKWERTAATISEGGFIVTMPNDSMSGANNPRSLPAGCSLTVETEFNADELNEKIVLVAVDGSPVAMVKEYIQDGPSVFLRAFNPAYPMLNTTQFRVIGVIKQAVINL